MSKNVIVFSTYFNCPFQKDSLFNLESSTSLPMTDKELCDFLWDDIKENPNAKSVLDELPLYLNDESKNEIEEEARQREGNVCKELGEFVNNNKEVLDNVLEKYNVIRDDNYNWIKMLDLLMTAKKDEMKGSQVFIDLFAKGEKYKGNHKLEILKKKDSRWIARNLLNEGEQKKYNIYLQEGTTADHAPWIHHRFSYYRLNDFSDEVVVYAIWPIELSYPIIDKKNVWIDNLSKQFLSLNNDVENLYFVLHDKDIKTNVISGTIDYPQLDNKAVRTVALFQHTGEFGQFLKDKDKTSVDVLKFVTLKLTTRGQVIELYEQTIKGDLSTMKVIKDKLPDDKFKNIKDIISRLDENSLQEGKQDMEYYRLIAVLNDEIRKIELGETI